jgi:hypothetical protein
MTEAPEEPDPGTNPRRDSWSLRTIVQEVSGRSIEDFQDPDRAPHPYLRVKPPPGGHHPPGTHPGHHAAVLASGSDGESPPAARSTDPVDRFYPPLVGAVGRQTHGPGEIHHAATLEEGSLLPGVPSTSPSRRPERVYLHYLLLHLDRLSDHALHYLDRAVAEEAAHRRSVAAARPPPAEADRTPP